jgi:PAS domain S-box-containing protein
MTDAKAVSQTELSALKARLAQLSFAEKLSGRGSWSWDAATGAASWSDEMFRLLGLTPGEREPSQSTLEAFVHPDERRLAATDLPARFEDGRRFERTFRILLGNGDTRTVSIFGEPMQDAAGTPIGLVGVMEDVTSRRKVEDSLAESEQRLRVQIDHAPEAIVVFDADTRSFVDANTNALELFGRDRDALLKLGPIDLSPPTQPDGRVSVEVAAEKIGEALAGKAPVFEWTHLNADGDPVPCEVRLVRLPASGRNLVRGCVTNIAGRKRAEEQLRETARHLERAQRIANIGSWSWDMTSAEGVWSDELYELVGLEKGRLPTSFETFSDCIHPDDRKRFLDEITRCRLAQCAFDLEHRIVRPDGREIVVRCQGEMDFNAEGAPTRFNGVVQDITQARGTESALRQSQAQLVRAQRVAGVGSWYRDPRSSEAYWSDEVYAILGRQRGEQATSLEFLTACIHPADRERYLAARARVFRDGQGDGYDLELRVVRPDGEVRFVRMLAEYDRDDDGQVTGITGVIQDITQFKAATDALERTKLTLDSFLDASPDAVIITDPEARVTVFSRGAEAIFGHSAHEMIGQAVDRLIPERMRGAHETETHPLADCAVAADAQCSHAELIGLRKSGEEFPVQASLSRLETSAGVFYGAILRDVGAQEAARQELIRAKEGAEAANRAKSQFLANMSHEIRTPMNGVLGMAAVLQGTELNERQTRMVGTIRESGDMLMEVINNVLDISKIEAGAVEFEQLAFSPPELMRKIEAVHALKAKERGLSLRVLHGSGGSEPRLGDPTRFQQILHNLVSNALKFTDNGGVVVRLSGDADVLTCEVGDTGAGMSPEQCVRVLEPFTQADESITRKHGGTGLGLSIVKGLVSGLAGDLSIQSAQGAGTTFTIRLPFSLTHAGARAGGEQPRNPADASTGSIAPRRLRILVADDNTTNLSVIEAMLERVDCELVFAEHGARAAELFAPGAFDLVFMDIHMPIMDGETALAAIRAKEAAWPSVTPVYALTADVLEHRVAQYAALGFQGCIAKPIDARTLMATIELAARRAPAQRGDQAA